MKIGEKRLKELVDHLFFTPSHGITKYFFIGKESKLGYVVAGSFAIIFFVVLLKILTPIYGNFLVCDGIRADNRLSYDKGKKLNGLNTAVICVPIVAAARAGNSDYLKDLIRLKFDLHHKSFSGDTPLIFAIDAGKTKNFILLLKAGANICVKGRNGKSPLESALIFDRPIMASILFEMDPKIDVSSEKIDGFKSLVNSSEEFRRLYYKKMRECKVKKCKRACFLKDTHLKNKL